MLRLLMKVVGALVGLAACGALMIGLALTLAYPNLPDLDALTHYHPKVPLRVYTADKVLIGEFGEERRDVVRIAEVPDVMKAAILSAEDDGFYKHGGIDWAGMVRATATNLVNMEKSQGASTITMQVARNFYLSSEKTYTRKLYELLLTYKIESNLTKDQILELYINQIYLGQRAYGFASAARTYFGKQLSEVTPAEAAMLAGLPKAPSRYNPVVNPTRAKLRQQYVLRRMRQLGYLTEPELQIALAEPMRPPRAQAGVPGMSGVHAEYVAELARQLMHDTFHDETYSRGLNVYTTVQSDQQEAAYAALRDGVLDYDRRHGYRGPEGVIDLPHDIEQDAEQFDELLDTTLEKYPDSGKLVAAVVLATDAKRVVAARSAHEIVEITGAGLKFAQPALSAKAKADLRIRRGAVVRLQFDGKAWEILQMPEVQAAFVSADPRDGAIKAMVGGFDFNRGHFNRVTQAWRQPGSSFKPFIYAASLEKGLTPATVISDAPFVQESPQHWAPKNDDGQFGEPLTMKQALAKSKNMVSIRILQAIGPQYAQEYASRFGFEPQRTPAYLTLALGVGQTTPLQMAGAYSVFANGGYRVEPYLIDHVTDGAGKVLMQARPTKAGDETLRVIDARTAFVTDTLLKNNVRAGTASRAGVLKRNDLGGKTGTTNDSLDAWFAGYSPSLVGIAWMGYDQPKSLGAREFGSNTALPIWVDYMRTALAKTPQVERTPPPGLMLVDGDYYFDEFPPGQAVASVGLPIEPPSGPAVDVPAWGDSFGRAMPAPSPAAPPPPAPSPLPGPA